GDSRTLHLDRHRAAVAKFGSMHLTERGGGERGRVEFGKALGKPDSQLRFDDFFDVGERESLDLVLQSGERVEIRDGEKIRASREQLTKLDKGGTQLFKVARQGLGVGNGRFRAPLSEGNLSREVV